MRNIQEILEKHPGGGLLDTRSVQRVGPRVTDNVRQIPVAFTGSLPDLFRDGKGVVAQGSLGADGIFTATEVLAKYEDRYVPAEAAEALPQARPPVDAKGAGTGAGGAAQP